VAASRLKRGVALALALAAGLPAAALLTLATWRWWGWLEARTGIEALGHSGPAGGCYVAVLAPVWAATLWRWRRRAR